MNRVELKGLIEKISLYRPYWQGRLGDKVLADLCKEWLEILGPYDIKDINNNLVEFLKDKNNSNKEPTSYDLIRGLTPSTKKEELEEMVVMCDICHRKMDYEKIPEHEDRCRSIRYLKKLYAKYFNREFEVTNELYSMDNKSFNKRYIDVLRKVSQMENDEPFIDKVLLSYDTGGYVEI